MLKCPNNHKPNAFYLRVEEMEVLVDPLTEGITGAYVNDKGQAGFINFEEFELISQLVKDGPVRCPECQALVVNTDIVEVQTEEGEKVTVQLKNWIMQRIEEERESPMVRVLTGTIERETNKAILFHGKAAVRNTIQCSRCLRELTHPVSRLVGIGPVCCEKLGIPRPNFDELKPEDLEYLRQQITAITYDGWLPKSQITFLEG